MRRAKIKRYKGITKHIETIKALTIIMIVALVFVCMFFKINANGSELKYNDEFHKSMEREYVDSIKNVLKDMGMKDAGVSLLKIIDPDLGVTYTIQIHHRLIDRMSDEAVEELSDSLFLLGTPVAGSLLNLEYI